MSETEKIDIENEILETQEEAHPIGIQQDLLDSELGVEAADAEDANEQEAEDVVPSHLEPVQIRSVIESILLASEKPMSLASIKEVFRGTNVNNELIRGALSDLMVDYAGAERGLVLMEVAGGYQLRTKPENMIFVRRLVKGRPFKLSGPALEVLSIVAYKQPIIKHEVDEIRGVESGHLLRALMDRNLVRFVGKSELPGKPMLYGTTRKFLEVFGLRDLRELPSLSEIDALLPDGIGEEVEQEDDKDLSQLQEMAMEIKPEDEEKGKEWVKITEQLAQIETTTEFFEKEKERMKRERDLQRAAMIREAIEAGEEVENRDKKWLARWEAQELQAQEAAQKQEQAIVAEQSQDSMENQSVQEESQEPLTEDVKLVQDEPVDNNDQNTEKSSTEKNQEALKHLEELQMEKALKEFDNEN